MVADAATYDQYLVPAIFEPWSREVINRAKVFKGDRVLDVATGSGIVACRIAATGAKVTGIDIDADRLALARQRASDEGVAVTFKESSAESLPFRQPEFDLVTCQHGLQFVGNQPLACREMRRVTAPGGRAVISTWCAVEQQGPFHVVDEIAAKHTGKRHVHPFSLGDQVALNKLLVDAKFFAIAIDTVTRQVRLPDPQRFATMALTTISGQDAESLAPAIAEATAALAPFVEGDSMVFKMTGLVAVGRVKT